MTLEDLKTKLRELEGKEDCEAIIQILVAYINDDIITDLVAMA